MESHRQKCCPYAAYEVASLKTHHCAAAFGNRPDPPHCTTNVAPPEDVIPQGPPISMTGAGSDARLHLTETRTSLIGLLQVEAIMTAEQRKHSLIASDRIEGAVVRRVNGDRVGKIERLMLDKVSGKVAYAVLSFGGILGIGN